ncbi:MAG: guanylate kinase [Firmicutes bacterium]|nr:guanylate kinase [Bacillota bacterium]
MNKKGLLMIISGPSGSGKGTVVEELIKDENFVISVSATTRSPRDYEQDGVHYFFKTVDEFGDMINEGQLLEWAAFCGNYYGTPKAYVEKMLESGKNVILEIEVQGAQQIAEMYPEAVSVFLMPPSKEELIKRLTGRGTEDEITVERRIKRAEEEVELLPKYKFVVINDEVANAVEKIKMIAESEKMRSERYKNMVEAFK